MLVNKLLLLFCLSVAASGRVPFFRRDYSYIDQFDAFYKLHLATTEDTWSSAFQSCDDEGSILFYPKTKDEWTVIKTLVAGMKVNANITGVLVGIHDETGMGEFITVEGLPTPIPFLEEYQPASDGAPLCVIMDVESGAYHLDACLSNVSRSFVCKKVEEKLPTCPTIDHEYMIHSEIKKCYKEHRSYKTWTDAMFTCFMEGGHLAVITNSMEAKIFKSQMQDGDYFIGFRRASPIGDFYTVTGKKFDSVHYQVWWSTREENTQADCGVARVDSRYDPLYTVTRDCQNPASFVCEMVASYDV